MRIEQLTPDPPMGRRARLLTLLPLIFLVLSVASLPPSLSVDNWYESAYFYSLNLSTGGGEEAGIGGREESWGKGALYTVTRRQAVTAFVAELQMEEGGFVNTLTTSRSSASTMDSDWAVAVLSALGALSIIDVNILIQFVKDCQKADGSLALCPWEIEVGMCEAVCGTETLRRLGALDAINGDALADWVMSCYREDGGFNDKPTNPSTILWTTEWAIQVLHALGELDRIDRQRTIQYVMDGYYRGEEGGFSLTPGGSRSLIGTSSGVPILYLLDALSPQIIETTADYIMGLYDPAVGCFINSLADTFVAVYCLKLLGELDRVNRTEVTEYVLACQNHLSGGFARTPSNANTSCMFLFSSYEAVMILQMLGMLDVLEEEFEVEQAPVWVGDDTPPTTRTPTTPTTPPVPPEVWARVILGCVAGGALIFSFSYGMVTLANRWPRRRRRKMRRRRR